MVVTQFYRERSVSLTKAPVSIKTTSSEEWLIDTPPTRVTPRQIHWWTPTVLTTSFAIGVLAAICQHALYRSIHRTSVESETVQTALIFCGRALAYVANIAFAQAIITSYNQRIWKTVQRHDLSLRSIDRLFSGTEDLSLFFSFEILRTAPLVTSMALILRFLPIATIIASPSALSIGLRTIDSEAILPVPTVNFTVESDFNWRLPQKDEDGQSKRSLLYYNTTDLSAEKPGWFDYYDQPSQELAKLINLNIFSSPNEILNSTFNQEGTRQNICGGQYNCTYTISFLGPSYKCEDYSDEPGGPVDTGILSPQGPYLYYAEVDTGDYARPQIDNVAERPGGVPIGAIPAHAGDFRIEPEIWIGYSETRPNDKNFTDAQIARCIHYEAKYTVTFNFTSQVCLVKTSTELLDPILGHDFSEPYSVELPQDQWINPRDDVEKYKKTAAYHAVGEIFRTFLSGNIEYHVTGSGSRYVSVHSDVTKTSLFDRSSPAPNMIERLQELYQGMVVTVITQRQFLVNDNEEVMVHRTQHRIAFIYNPMRLWICYAPVVLLSLLILLIGAWTIWEEKATMSTSFSRILATTRNPTLDYIASGVCLGHDPFPGELMKTKLRFGALLEVGQKQNGGLVNGADNRERHCAFGVSSEVEPIKKGTMSSGVELRRWLDYDVQMEGDYR